MQAYTGISDDEVIEVLVMDRRWQLVLDCHDCQKPPFSKGTFVQFRKILINKGLDQRLVERTVEIAKKRGGFSSGRLRAALDSSPLWGAAKIDRAYLSSQWVKAREENLQIFCKAWPVRNGERFDKTAFILDWNQGLIRCPNQVTIPFEQGKVVQFPKQACAVCPLRSRCTTSTKGRTVSIHPDEALMQELRKRQSTAVGRTQLRQRVAVEHSLAHIGHWLLRPRPLSRLA